MNTLYGRELANVIPRGITGHQARTMFSELTRWLANAYQTLTEYQSTGTIGMIFPGLAKVKFYFTGEAVAAAKQYLDSTNAMLQKYFPQMPASTERLPDLQFTQLQTSVSGTSVAVREVDQMFGTPWSAELSNDIVEAAGTVSAWLANKVAKVVGNTLGGILGQTWWILLLGAGGVWVYYRIAGGGLAKRLAERIRS
jgi:hypothetical protein